MTYQALDEKSTTVLNELIHKIYLSFTPKIMGYPRLLPSKFKMPQIKNFNSTKDPLDH